MVNDPVLWVDFGELGQAVLRRSVAQALNQGLLVDIAEKKQRKQSQNKMRRGSENKGAR